jgi:hypothetical protein
MAVIFTKLARFCAARAKVIGAVLGLALFLYACVYDPEPPLACPVEQAILTPAQAINFSEQYWLPNEQGLFVKDEEEYGRVIEDRRKNECCFDKMTPDEVFYRYYKGQMGISQADIDLRLKTLKKNYPEFSSLTADQAYRYTRRGGGPRRGIDGDPNFSQAREKYREAKKRTLPNF